MSGFFERRRLAKEEARQRAIETDLAANDLIALHGPPKPRPQPGPTPAGPTPPVPAPAAEDPVTQADAPSPWAAPMESASERPSTEPAPVMSTPPAPAPPADRTEAERQGADRAGAANATDPDGVCRQLLQLPGATAAAVVDGDGMSLAAHGDAGFDLDAGAAAAGEVLLAHRDLLGDDRVTEATITTGRRHLLLHAAGPAADGLLVYLVLDAGRGNLAGARRRLSQLAAGLTA